MPNTPFDIDRIDGDIIYQQFLDSYLLPNRPCLISPSLTLSWPCFRHWAMQSPSGSDPLPNWQYLSQTYGAQEVSVADCNTREFSDQKRTSMSVARAIETLVDAKSSRGLPYIKDWHLVLRSSTAALTNEDDKIPYETPKIFRDDWLNNSHSQADDFRFCYVGVSGSFTPLHRDVYASYSWSTNVVGVKIWRLFPPETAPLLRKIPSNRRSEGIYDVRTVDSSIFTRWEEARGTMLVIRQNPGETIFVPSNWYHQVENVTDCISLNHNWCNSVNLPWLYAAMKDEVEEVEGAISDVKDMMRHAAAAGDDIDKDWQVDWLREVDKLVKMDAGWGWEHFFQMIEFNIAAETVVAPGYLRPSDGFVRERVRGVVEDFLTRDEYALLPEVKLVVDRIFTALFAT